MLTYKVEHAYNVGSGVQCRACSRQLLTYKVGHAYNVGSGGENGTYKLLYCKSPHALCACCVLTSAGWCGTVPVAGSLALQDVVTMGGILLIIVEILPKNDLEIMIQKMFDHYLHHLLTMSPRNLVK